MERHSPEHSRSYWQSVKETVRSRIESADTHLITFFGKRLKEVQIMARAKFHLEEDTTDQSQRNIVYERFERGFNRLGFQPGAGEKIARVVLEVFENEQRVERARISGQRPKRKFFKM